MEDARTIPVEVLGPIVDQGEDQLDAEELVKSLNQHINRGGRESSLPPRRSRSGSARRSAGSAGSSNRASLVVTHEDGSTEDVEGEVTCLGLSMDSGWGALGTRGGLSIQELAGDDASLNSFLSEEGGETYAEPIQSCVVLEEDEDETSGSNTPQQVPPRLVTAEVHSISIHRAPLPPSSPDTKGVPQIVTHCEQKGKTILIESHSSSHVKEGTSDQVTAPTKTSPSSQRIPVTPSDLRGDTQPTQQEGSSSKSLKLDLRPTESSSVPIHIDRLPPTPSPTPPSQLATPSSTPPTKTPPNTPTVVNFSPTVSNSSPTVSNSSPTVSNSTPKSAHSSPSRLASNAPKTIPITSGDRRALGVTASPRKEETFLTRIRSEETVVQEKVRIAPRDSEGEVGRGAEKVVRVPIGKSSSTTTQHSHSENVTSLKHSRSENITSKNHSHSENVTDTTRQQKKGLETNQNETVENSAKTQSENVGREERETGATERISRPRTADRAVPIRIIPIALPDGRVIERKDSEQTTIDTEFTECIETNFQKEEPRKPSGLSRKSPEKEETKGKNVTKAPPANVARDITASVGRDITASAGPTQGSEETLKSWKANLETACSGRSTLVTGGSQSGRQESGTGGLQSGKQERIIPIVIPEGDISPKVPEKEEAPGSQGEGLKSRVIPILLTQSAAVQGSRGHTESSRMEDSSVRRRLGQDGGREDASGDPRKEQVKVAYFPTPTSPTLTQPKPTSPTPTNLTLNSSKPTSPTPTSPTLISRTPTFPTASSPTPSSPTPTPPTPTSPTTTSSKPPLQAVRTIPILKQASTASPKVPAGGTRQRNQSQPSQPSKKEDQEELVRLTRELEESHRKLQSQAQEMAGRQPGLVRVETRSRSVESEQRAAPGTRSRYLPVLKRERSLQDIDKDISTIWAELQSLDTANPDPSSPPPLSEQTLVCPSWRQSGPLSAPTTGGPRAWIPRAETRPGAITPSYVSPSPRQARAAFFAQPAPETSKIQEPGKPSVGTSTRILETDFPASNKPTHQPASQPASQSGTKPGQPASQSVNQPASQRVSRPGQPVYMSASQAGTQSSQTSGTQTSTQTGKVPTSGGTYNTSSLPSRLPSGQKRSQTQPYSLNPASSTYQSSSQKSLYNSSQTSSYSSMKTETDSRSPRGAEPLKSCLKSESRSSSATRSETSGMRESPVRQGVNFVSQPNIKPYQAEHKEQDKANRDSSESEPFDWVEFKSNGGGGVQGSILTGDPRSDRRSPGRRRRTGSSL